VGKSSGKVPGSMEPVRGRLSGVIGREGRLVPWKLVSSYRWCWSMSECAADGSVGLLMSAAHGSVWEANGER
jgi:hypothetical protein